MKIYIKYSLWLFAALCFAVMLNSCKKDSQVTKFTPSRAFTPASITATVSGASVTFTWPASLFSGGTGVTYTLQVSKNANFATIDYSKVTPTTTLTLTDEQLTVGQAYFVRVKANATETADASNAFVANTSSFTMPGILQTVTNADLTSKTVTLKWLAEPTVTKITITPVTPVGTPFDVALAPADVTAAKKLVTGLLPNVIYRAEIYAGTRVKGFTTFTTPVYTRVITTADNLIDVITNAADGDIIGMNPGVYEAKDATAAYANITILQKTVTLQSTSGNPGDTKVNYKQIDLKGNGAGITVKNIGFDGTLGAAPYFINLTGVAADAEKATFTNIIIDGCTVSGAANALIRANRGSAAGDYKIGNITINNSVINNINAANTGFNSIELTKLQFTRIDITNSTFFDFGRSLVVATTALGSGVPMPVINIDKSTFNYFGGNNMNVLVDANTNPVAVTVTNSIIANTPKANQTVSGLIRATGSGATVNVNNNNTFGLNNGSGGTITFPTNAQGGANTTVDLGWTASITNFTLPAGSSLRTAGSTGGAIGDPRWAK